MNITFNDNVVIVTGGAKGIGRAACVAFAKAGARVVLADVDLPAAQATVIEIQAQGGKCIAQRVDVRDAASCKTMADAAMAQWGRIDVLVNNAGVSQPHDSATMPEEIWNRIIDINLSGAFFCSQAVAPAMMAQSSGVILSVASIAAYVGFPGRAPYCASKAGIVALTQVLGCEWAQHNIRVNAVAPGYVMTELVEQNVQRGIVSLPAVEGRTPLRRLASPEDIANMLVMLASDQASYVTGQTVLVDGGWTAYGGW
jgi:3-oxoacyl-[acyl-carrier protein] reductase